MPSVTFRKAISVDLDASGAGAVLLQPPGVAWAVDGSSVETATSTLHPRADVTINGGWVEGTYSGHRDTSDTRHRLGPTDQISCSWTGGDAGTRATFRIWGVQYPAGQMP